MVLILHAKGAQKRFCSHVGHQRMSHDAHSQLDAFPASTAEAVEAGRRWSRLLPPSFSHLPRLILPISSLLPEIYKKPAFMKGAEFGAAADTRERLFAERHAQPFANPRC